MTRLINVSGRLKLKLADGVIDVEKASNGRFASDPQRVYEQWNAFAKWAASKTAAEEPLPDAAALDVPVPAPRQIVAAGLNYHSHITHSRLIAPSEPGVFVKLLTSLNGPRAEVEVEGDAVFTEAELAVVIGREVVRIGEKDALDYVAGAVLAQDLYDRHSVVKVASAEGAGGVTYINPSKSRPGYTPLGPEVVSLDEAGNLADLPIHLDINDTPIQRGNSSDLVFSVPELVARLSHKIRLLPGDVVLTGSPARLPGAEGRALRPGDVIRAFIPGLGEQRTVAVQPAHAVAVRRAG